MGHGPGRTLLEGHGMPCPYSGSTYVGCRMRHVSCLRQKRTRKHVNGLYLIPDTRYPIPDTR